MVLIQPDAQSRSEQRRHDDRPTDKAHHAQTEPDPFGRIPPRFE
jgi:hypothetical protein